MKSRFFRNVSGRVGLVVVLQLSLLWAAGAGPAVTMAQMKFRFNARLDSLEMEKQNRKRLGRPLAYLDSTIAVLKDSIASVKQDIALAGDSVLSASAPLDTGMSADTAKPLRRSFLEKVTGAHLPMTPKTMIDWVIAAVGLIAVLSGIVLVFGLLRAFIFRPKREKPSYTETVRAQSPYSRQGLPGGDALQKKNTAGAIPPASGAFDIDALRRKIARSDQEETAPPVKLPGAESSVEQVQDGEALKQRIIEAGREGLSVSDISRKFHVSVDQVSLILKIAGKK